LDANVDEGTQADIELQAKRDDKEERALRDPETDADDDIDAELGNDRQSFFAADINLDVGDDFDASINLGDDLGHSFRGASAVGAGSSVDISINDGLNIDLEVDKDIDHVALGRRAAATCCSLGERVDGAEAVDRAGRDKQTKGQEEQEERQDAGGLHCESWRLDRADRIC